MPHQITNFTVSINSKKITPAHRFYVIIFGRMVVVVWLPQRSQEQSDGHLWQKTAWSAMGNVVDSSALNYREDGDEIEKREGHVTFLRPCPARVISTLLHHRQSISLHVLQRHIEMYSTNGTNGTWSHGEVSFDTVDVCNLSDLDVRLITQQLHNKKHTLRRHRRRRTVKVSRRVARCSPANNSPQLRSVRTLQGRGQARQRCTWAKATSSLGTDSARRRTLATDAARARMRERRSPHPGARGRLWSR